MILTLLYLQPLPYLHLLPYAPTTSPTAAPTTLPPTTPSPPEKYNYNVTDDKTVCIMLSGKISFNIEYPISPKTTNKTTVVIPEPSNSVQTSGNCSASNHEISISWGPPKQQHQVLLKFNLSKDKKSWMVSYMTALIPFDDQFINSTDEGSLSVNVTVVMEPHEVPVNQSFKCVGMTGGNYTAHLDDSNATYTYPISVDFTEIQLQAFNQIAGNKNFVDAIHCDADKTSDIVPIAVGCALGGLVVIVLIAYVVGRRRRSAAYQSV